MLWVLIVLATVFALAAVFLGAQGKSVIHRVAVLAGMLTVICLIALFPMAIYGFFFGMSGGADRSLSGPAIFLNGYFVLMVVSGLTSVITAIVLSWRKIGVRQQVLAGS